MGVDLTALEVYTLTSVSEGGLLVRVLVIEFRLQYPRYSPKALHIAYTASYWKQMSHASFVANIKMELGVHEGNN